MSSALRVRATPPTKPSPIPKDSERRTCSMKRARVVSLTFELAGQGPMGRKETLDRNPLQPIAIHFLKDAGAEGTGGENGRMHDPLEELLPRKTLPEGLDHVVHEFDHDLLLLENELPLGQRTFPSPDAH